MTLRSPRERIFQTICYEICALSVSVPLYALMADKDAGPAVSVMVAMMIAETIWASIHDFLFDWTDLRLSGRVASNRPKRWRAVHAISHEGSAMIVTLPVLMWTGGHHFWAAFVLDLGLTLMYACYAFVFYLVFDWFRPVVPRHQPVEKSQRGPGQAEAVVYVTDYIPARR